MLYPFLNLKLGEKDSVQISQMQRQIDAMLMNYYVKTTPFLE